MSDRKLHHGASERKSQSTSNPQMFLAHDDWMRDQLLSILPKGIPPELIAAIEDAAHETLTSHGLSAFEMSRDAAIAHEIGHTIVAAAEGVVMQSVRIFSRSTPAGTAWGGWCTPIPEDDKEWTTGPDSSVESDLSRARIIIAGLTAEVMTGLDKPGSSLDELAMSQLIGHNAAMKLAKPKLLSDAAYVAFAKQLWHERVWGVTIEILRANHGPFQQLAGHLDRKERIKGDKLRAVLTQIRRITP
jgi:hypothetical protein